MIEFDLVVRMQRSRLQCVARQRDIAIHRKVAQLCAIAVRIKTEMLRPGGILPTRFQPTQVHPKAAALVALANAGIHTIGIVVADLQVGVRRRLAPGEDLNDTAEGVRAVMRKHAGSLAPKFDRVLEILQDRLGEYEVARWTTPEGGYFISLDVIDGTASRVVELAKEAGIALTGAGSSFPHKDDPNNRNIRLAPSLPPVEELEVAMDGVATCVLLAAVEKLGA